MHNFFLLALFVLIAIFACNKNKSNETYSEFALVYAELRIAEREYGETEDGKAIRFQILQRHGLSVNTFEERMDSIKEKPEEWLKFQNMLIAILDSISASSKIEE